MEDDEKDGAAAEARDRAAIGNRTIQIDALTDVQLIDHRAEEALLSRAPPPLPSKRQGPSAAKRLGFLVFALVAGAGSAYAIVHFVFPSGAAPTATAPPAPAATAPTPSEPAAEAPPAALRQVHLDEDFVIRADEPAAPE